MTITRTILLLLLTGVLAGCTGGDPADAAAAGGHGGDAEPAPTNRVDIPLAVRRNLGITFAGVERRRVARTLRVPGRFELQPRARREYRTMVPGRIELLVDQYDTVAAGDLLYRLDSSAWRRMQQSLADLEARIMRLETTLETFTPLMEAHARHEQSLAETLKLWRERVAQLEAVRDAGGGRAGDLSVARTSVAATQAEFADVQEKDATLLADRAKTEAELSSARSQREFQLTSAASLLDVDVSTLSVRTATGHSAWAEVTHVEVRAAEAGVVELLSVTNGGWADEEAMVLSTIQPDRLRFHAKGLQSDLGHFRDGLEAMIVAPSPTRSTGSIDLEDTMSGTLVVGISGDPRDRTIDLFVTPESLSTWARPGVSAQLEIVLDGAADATLAIPLAAVQRDGIRPVIFRRDPKDPNAAIRVEADLGVDDGRWIAIRSGVMDADEVVLDGAYQLMLALSRTSTKGGHFHADGTFHADDSEH